MNYLTLVEIPADAGGAPLLGLPNDQALPSRLDGLLGHCLQGVDFENSFNLSEQTIQQPEVAAGDSDDGRHCFWVQRLLWKTNAGWRSPPLQQFVDLLGGQGPKLMDEADTGVELRVACQVFLKAGHPD